MGILESHSQCVRVDCKAAFIDTFVHEANV